MAARKAPKGDQLYTLVVDVRHGGGLYTAGLQLLGDDDLVRARPEPFARFDLGYREVVAVRAALDRAEIEERQAQARAAAPPPEPQPEPRVVATKQFQHAGQTIEVGSVWSAASPLVESVPTAFAVVED